jgi:hypothetical protein
LSALADVAERIVKARQDFKIPVSATGNIEVKRGEQLLAKIYPNIAKIKIGGVWYDVSRNWVTPIGIDASLPIREN